MLGAPGLLKIYGVFQMERAILKKKKSAQEAGNLDIS